MKTLTHLLITASFAVSCAGLWTLLQLFGTLSGPSFDALPTFTRALVNARGWLLVLPLPVVAYCAYALRHRLVLDRGGPLFLSCTVSALLAVLFPVLLGLFLPLVVLLDQTWGK